MGDFWNTETSYVKGKEFGLAIWLGIMAGLRIGEVEALQWKNVDLKNGLIHVRATFDRKTRTLRDYPKGKKWFTVTMPKELWEMMKSAHKEMSSDFVCGIPQNSKYKIF